MSSLATVETRLRSAVARVRVMRAVDAAVGAAAVVFAIAALAAFAHWLWPEHVRQLGPAAACVLASLPVLAALISAARSVAPLPVLIRLDRSHGLSDLLSSAWELARLPERDRGTLVSLTIARAEQAAASLDVRRSLPWHRPRAAGWLIGASIAAALALSLRPPPSAALEVAAAEPGQPLEQLVSPADLARFRERLARLDSEIPRGTRLTAVRSELDRLLDELERGPADRVGVLRRLGQLEEKARRASSAARAAGAAPLTRPSDVAHEATSAADSTGAPRANEPAPTTTVTELAPPAPAKENARTAREEPAEQPQPSAAQAPPPSREEAPPPPAMPQELQLPAGAPNGAQPPGGSNGAPQPPQDSRPVAAAPSQPGTDDAPRGPDLERKRANPNPQKGGEQLADAISELRDLMRRDSPIAGNADDRAPGTPNERSDDARRNDSPGNKPGAPNSAYARGGPPPQSGSEPGEPSREDVPKLPAESSRVSGARSAGPVRSQVIYGAAQRGFTGGDYARVHAEYEDHAERELEHEAIPPGYRGYVRRYFEAIAPRKSP